MIDCIGLGGVAYPATTNSAAVSAYRPDFPNNAIGCPFPLPNDPYSLSYVSSLQCGTGPSHPAECGHQEAVQTLPECHTRQARLSRIQTDEPG